MTQKILRIAISTPLRRLFDYLLPDDFSGQLIPGQRFKVPFGRRQTIGILVEVAHETRIPAHNLKYIIHPIDRNPVLSSPVFSLCLWASNYYHHPIGEVLFTALPKLLRQGNLPLHTKITTWKPGLKASLEPGNRLRKLSATQQKALSILIDHPDGLSQEFLEGLGLSSRTLQALANRDLAIIEESARSAISTNTLENPLAQTHLSLNEEQTDVLHRVLSERDHYQCFVIDGITGSGKTEIYLQLIEALIKEGQQALVLVPEIGLTPQTFSRFKHRFVVEIACVHSQLNDKQRLSAWSKAQSGQAKVVIGTRSAIFSPFKNLGVIIVDEEHDPSFKQQAGFQYSARDLAVFRAKQESIPVLLGSATPSLETWLNCMENRYAHLRLTQRAGSAVAPDIGLIDTRGAQLRDGLSNQLIDSIHDTLERGEQALIFINQRGYAPTLVCNNCGWAANCPFCDIRLTVHRRASKCQCHCCGFVEPIATHCQQCQSTDIDSVGAGTERIEAAMHELFSSTPIIRIDRDTAKGKSRFGEFIERIQEGKPMILVGTQMIAKGHHFPNVTLAAILNTDAGLFSADFRGPERTAQLISQVSGRAGRAERPGQAWIQTNHMNNPLLSKLISQGYHAFAALHLQERQRTNLPPFRSIALIRANAKTIELAINFLEECKKRMAKVSSGVELWGPAPSPTEKRINRYHAQLLLNSKSRTALHQTLSQLVTWLDVATNKKAVHWSIDVDPIELY